MKNKKIVLKLKSFVKGHHWEVNSWKQILDNKIEWVHYKIMLYDKLIKIL